MHNNFWKRVQISWLVKGKEKRHPRSGKISWPVPISSVDRSGRLSIFTKHQMAFMCEHWRSQRACSEATGVRCKWRHTEKILGGDTVKTPQPVLSSPQTMMWRKLWGSFYVSKRTQSTSHCRYDEMSSWGIQMHRHRKAIMPKTQKNVGMAGTIERWKPYRTLLTLWGNNVV